MRNRTSDLRIPRSEGLGSTPHGDSEFFLCPTLVIKRKNLFPYFFTELKTYHLSYFYLQRLNYVRHHSVLGHISYSPWERELGVVGIKLFRCDVMCCGCF